ELFAFRDVRLGLPQRADQLARVAAQARLQRRGRQAQLVRPAPARVMSPARTAAHSLGRSRHSQPLPSLPDSDSWRRRFALLWGSLLAGPLDRLALHVPALAQAD